MNLDGLPKIPDPAERPISVRFDKETRAILEELQKKSRISISEWIRQLVKKDIDARKSP
jgi:hypothetical protein